MEVVPSLADRKRFHDQGCYDAWRQAQARLVVEQRFDAKWAPRPDGCREWSASRTPSGYGKFFIEGRLVPAHQYAYERAYGPVPQGLVIDHLCRNRFCVNPDHLEAVPQRVNLARGMSPPAIANRRGTCGKGHPYTVRGGRNFCSICTRENERRRGARRKAARLARGLKGPATHCRNGHLFTQETTAWITRGDGKRSRYCRLCKNATWRRMYQRRMATASG